MRACESMAHAEKQTENMSKQASGHVLTLQSVETAMFCSQGTQPPVQQGRGAGMASDEPPRL